MSTKLGGAQGGGGMGAIMQNGQPASVGSEDGTDLGFEGASSDTLSGAQPEQAFTG